MPRKAKIPGKSRAALAYDGPHDPMEFLVPASDKHGHNAKVHLRVAVGYDQEAHKVVNSRLFPFLDVSDLYRWCVKVGLEILGGMEEIPNSVYGQAEAATEVAREILLHQQHDKAFQALGEALQLCQGRGAHGQARALYLRVRAKLEGMPAGWWRTHYLTRLETHYGEVLRGPLTDASPRGTGSGPGPGPGGME